MNASNSVKNLRKRYLQPIYVCIGLAVIGEILIFTIFGLILHPAGNIVHKFLWTIVFCGIGMGSALGAFIIMFVIDRFIGIKAIIITTLLSFMLLGLGCDFLCFYLDLHFHFFGANVNPTAFLVNGITASILGGLIAGFLLFTNKGQRWLSYIGI